jgi:glycosyltransferase involved in cell wall biosynthesis
MIELIRRLPADRWTVHVACIRAEGHWAARTAEAAASITEFPIRSFRHPEAYRQAVAFARWCSHHRIALVHTSDLYSNIFGLTGATFARVPVRIGSRRGLYLDLKGQLAMQRAAFSCAHAVIANSSAAVAQLRTERVPARKIITVPNGLDLAAFTPAADRGVRRRVITVGHLRTEKGHAVLIDAAVHVLKHFPDARFTLVGDGPERAALESRLVAHGITPAFEIVGERDDVPRFLANADISVLPSLAESLPNAALEAMAAALPVVASEVGGVPDVIEHRRTGLLVPAGDARELAEHICELMADASLGTRLGSAARARVQRQFSFERMVATVESVYTNELTRRGVILAEKAA